MKKVILVVSLMFGGAAFVNAQETDQTQPQTETSATQDQEGQQISVSELPEAVTAELGSADYSGWTVGSAYKKMDESQNEIYVVELRQGTETKKVKFDRDGNKIDKKDKHSDGTESSQYRDDSETQTSEDATLESEPQSSESEQDATSTEDATQSTTDQADNADLSEQDPK